MFISLHFSQSQMRSMRRRLRKQRKGRRKKEEVRKLEEIKTSFVKYINSDTDVTSVFVDEAISLFPSSPT